MPACAFSFSKSLIDLAGAGAAFCGFRVDDDPSAMENRSSKLLLDGLAAGVAAAPAVEVVLEVGVDGESIGWEYIGVVVGAIGADIVGAIAGAIPEYAGGRAAVIVVGDAGVVLPSMLNKFTGCCTGAAGCWTNGADICCRPETTGAAGAAVNPAEGGAVWKSSKSSSVKHIVNHYCGEE